jgi:CubicO group peptidase (beta-lactamase class C family)
MTMVTGDVPGAATEIAARAFRDLGLVGTLLAGAAGAGSMWTTATGCADLERDESLEPGTRFPAYGIAQAVTAMAVLRLVADGAVGLDEPANRHLRRLRLADATITVRELLCHTAECRTPPRRSPTGSRCLRRSSARC